MEETKNNVTENQQTAQQEGQKETTQKPESQQENKPTVEELMAQLAEAKAESQKYQNKYNQASNEAAETKKALRAKLTEAEQAEIAKQEADEEQKAYVESLEQYKKKNEAMKRYMTVQKMPADLAEKAADAEIAGDMDALTAIQNQHSESKLKEARADWQKSIPQPQFGTGEYSSMTKEEIMAIKDTDERVRAIAQNQHLFKQK